MAATTVRREEEEGARRPGIGAAQRAGIRAGAGCNNARVYRHDYILRLIERFGAALIALRNKLLRQTPDETATHAEIIEIAQQAGLDLDVARRLDPGLLLTWLAPIGDPDPAKLWLMAELLYLEGLRTKISGRPEWRGDLERALALLTRLPETWRPGDAFATAGERAAEIRAMVGDD